MNRSPKYDLRETTLDVVRTLFETHHPSYSASDGGGYSPWFSGPYGYEITSAVAFPSPIPCRGMLGFWRIPVKIIEDNLYAFRDAAKALERFL